MHAQRLVMALAATVLAALVSPPAGADEFDGVKPLTQDQMAKIRAEQEQIKQDNIDNTKGSDNYDEIHAAKRNIQRSLDKALQDNGVTKEQYMHEYTRTDRETKKQIEEKAKAIKEKTKADREAKAKASASDDGKVTDVGGSAEDKAGADDKGGSGIEIVKGYKDGAEGITVPAGVDSNGEKTPEIIKGYDADHEPAAPKTEGTREAPAPADPAP